jgi:arylsulfatase A-like enzyme
VTRRAPGEGTIGVAAVAGYGAAAWLAYGTAEALLVVAAPVLRRAGAAIHPGWFGDRGGTIGSLPVSLTAATLYAAVGLLLGGALALAFRSTPLRRVVRTPSPVFWFDLVTLSVLIAFGIHAWHVHEWPAVAACAVPCVAVTADLLVVWRTSATRHWSTATHPLVAYAALLLAAFTGQLGPAVKHPDGTAVAVVAAFAVIVTAEALDLATRGIRRRLGRARSAALVAAAVTILVAVASLGRPSAARPAGRQAGQPNVILITLDTVRADHLSSYGYSRQTTPNLDRLAATVYDHAIASSNWTLPSHASILTGVSPRRHGAHDHKGGVAQASAISPSVPTMAELLKARGYRTSAVVANVAVLLPGFGVSRGFDSYDLAAPDYVAGPQDPRYLLSSVVRNLASVLMRQQASLADADKVNRRADLELREAARQQKPLFLWLNYMDAHTPYVPPSPFDTRYPGKSADFDWSAFPHLVEEVSGPHGRPLTSRESAHLVSQYDGALSYLDDRLQRLFDRLRELHLYDDSLIVVTSDHGEALGEGMMLTHGLSLYQSQVSVPLIVKYPGARVRTRVAAPVSSVDILPTVLDVVGVPAPADLEGQLLEAAGTTPARWVTSESYRPRGEGFTSTDDGPDEMALFSGPWKLIVGGSGAIELYNLASDPGEQRNLSGRVPISRAWLNDVRTAMDEARRGGHTDAPPLDDDAVERLRALGYLR